MCCWGFNGFQSPSSLRNLPLFVLAGPAAAEPEPARPTSTASASRAPSAKSTSPRTALTAATRAAAAIPSPFAPSSKPAAA